VRKKNGFGGCERRRGALVFVGCVAEGRRSWRWCGGGKFQARGKGLERLVSERKKSKSTGGQLFG
jgi:hypothetical protein